MEVRLGLVELGEWFDGRRERRVGIGVRRGNVVVWLMVGLGGCVVWVLLSVLLSRFKASSITHPGAGLT